MQIKKQNDANHGEWVMAGEKGEPGRAWQASVLHKIIVVSYSKLELHYIINIHQNKTYVFISRSQ